MRLPLIVHERIGRWARQLRPRVASWPVVLVESRSAADLQGAASRSASPLVVLDLSVRLRANLEAIGRAVAASPNALLLALDPSATSDLPLLARELGATHVLTGPATPPEVEAILARWLPLALRRAEGDGWAPDRVPEAQPWDGLFPPLD